MDLADTVRAWSVPDVCFFFCQHDAAGIAAIMERSAVNGEDLLAFTSSSELEEDLHVTPFAARKALKLRDAFLAGAVSLF